MMASIDGKVTGSFLSSPECAVGAEIYYRINRDIQADGFICGRVTMNESFTGGWYPDLSKYEPVCGEPGAYKDFIPDELSGFYAIAFDTEGRLGWKGPKIIDPDGDPGYDGAQIIEVLSQQVDARYLGYLQSFGIPYIFAGDKSIDVPLALKKLKDLFGCKVLLLEGGSIINGAFVRAGAIDEISLVIAPVVAGREDKPLFMSGEACNFELVSAETEKGNLILKYKIKNGNKQ